MRALKSIGGYLGLDYSIKNDILNSKYCFNSARSSLLFYLKYKNIKKIWVPHYTCGNFLETLCKNEIDLIYYNIDENYEITTNIPDNDDIIYVNYYGIKDQYIKKISTEKKKIIIDNCQAFFNRQINKLPTFSCPRKFIGVADGGALECQDQLNLDDIDVDISHDRMSHLLKQIDIDTVTGYSDFISNEKVLESSSIKRMSRLTKKIIDSVDVNFIVSSRYNNFQYLNNNLYKHNLLKIDNVSLYYYPLMVTNPKVIRKKLLENRIFTPILWNDRLKYLNDGVEKKLISRVINLPIDQRYNQDDMDAILNILNEENCHT